MAVYIELVDTPRDDLIIDIGRPDKGLDPKVSARCAPLQITSDPYSGSWPRAIDSMKKRWKKDDEGRLVNLVYQKGRAVLPLEDWGAALEKAIQAARLVTGAAVPSTDHILQELEATYSVRRGDGGRAWGIPQSYVEEYVEHLAEAGIVLPPLPVQAPQLHGPVDVLDGGHVDPALPGNPQVAIDPADASYIMPQHDVPLLELPNTSQHHAAMATSQIEDQLWHDTLNEHTSPVDVALATYFEGLMTPRSGAYGGVAGPSSPNQLVQPRPQPVSTPPMPLLDTSPPVQTLPGGQTLQLSIAASRAMGGFKFDWADDFRAYDLEAKTGQLQTLLCHPSRCLKVPYGCQLSSFPLTVTQTGSPKPLEDDDLPVAWALASSADQWGTSLVPPALDQPPLYHPAHQQFPDDAHTLLMLRDAAVQPVRSTAYITPASCSSSSLHQHNFSNWLGMGKDLMYFAGCLHTLSGVQESAGDALVNELSAMLTAEVPATYVGVAFINHNLTTRSLRELRLKMEIEGHERRIECYNLPGPNRRGAPQELLIISSPSDSPWRLDTLHRIIPGAWAAVAEGQSQYPWAFTIAPGIARDVQAPEPSRRQADGSTGKGTSSSRARMQRSDTHDSASSGPMGLRGTVVQSSTDLDALRAASAVSLDEPVPHAASAPPRGPARAADIMRPRNPSAWHIVVCVFIIAGMLGVWSSIMLNRALHRLGIHPNVVAATAQQLQTCSNVLADMAALSGDGNTGAVGVDSRPFNLRYALVGGLVTLTFSFVMLLLMVKLAKRHAIAVLCAMFGIAVMGLLNLAIV